MLELSDKAKQLEWERFWESIGAQNSTSFIPTSTGAQPLLPTTNMVEEHGDPLSAFRGIKNALILVTGLGAVVWAIMEVMR